MREEKQQRRKKRKKVPYNWYPSQLLKETNTNVYFQIGKIWFGKGMYKNTQLVFEELGIHFDTLVQSRFV